LTKTWIKEHEQPLAAIATGPFGVDLSKENFLILPIPFNAGATEKTIPFYNPRWYEDIDVVITSDYDYGRYLGEPERFREMLNFYDTLRARWSLLWETGAGENQSGPMFWLYKSPGAVRDTFDTDLLESVEKVADSAEAVNFFGKLGEILSRKECYKKSEQLFIELLRVDSANERVQSDLAYVEFKLHHNDLALALVTTYLVRHPMDAEKVSMKGSILFELHRDAEAETALREALRIDNHVEEAYLTLNLLYARRGEKGKMIEILDRYLQILPPESARAQRVKQLLFNLKQSS